MKRSLLAVICTCVALAAGAWWWHAGRTQARVAAILPPQPELSASPAAMRDRIVAAETRARSRTGAGRGLAELARVYHANGFLAEALRCYRGLQELEPGEPRWPHLQATILAGYGDMEPAQALWRKVEELAPDYVPARLRLADCLFKTNQRDQAAAAYTEVLKRDRDNPYALLGLARLDLEAGRWEQARPRLEQVVSKTNYTLGYDLIVSLYERMGLNDRATTIRAMAKASGAHRDPADPWFDGLIEDCLDPYQLALTAGTLARSGDSPAAVRLLERAVAIAPGDVSALFQLGSLLIARRDHAGALQLMRRCTELAPDFADGWANLSALQAMLGETTAAERTLAEGLKNCPQSPGLHLQNARNREQAGRFAEAIAEFQTSIRLRPNEPEAYIELGNLYLRQGRQAEGMTEMERALAAEPGNPTALGVLAFNAIMRGDEAEARRRMAAAREQPRVPREQMQRLVTAFREKFGRAP